MYTLRGSWDRNLTRTRPGMRNCYALGMYLWMLCAPAMGNELCAWNVFVACLHHL